MKCETCEHNVVPIIYYQGINRCLNCDKKFERKRLEELGLTSEEKE